MEFEKVIPTLQQPVRIEKMSLLNAVQAIEGPCRVQHIFNWRRICQCLTETLRVSESTEGTHLSAGGTGPALPAALKKEGKPVFNRELLEKAGQVSDSWQFPG
ncbi:MAG: hypothetical protein U0T82_09205 [Bacteroidales bacterium]